MSRVLSVVALLAFGAAVAACYTPLCQGFPIPAQGCRYELTRGSSISITTETDGTNTIVATIAPGSDGAGEYVSTADALVERAREAKDALNEGRRITLIDVDADGRLVAIYQTR